MRLVFIAAGAAFTSLFCQSMAQADDVWLNIHGQCILAADGDVSGEKEKYAKCWSDHKYQLKASDGSGKACQKDSEEESCYELKK